MRIRASALTLAALVCLRATAYADVEANRPLVFVGNDNFPPYHYLSPEGEPRGFIVELLHALAREADFDVTIRLTPARDHARLIDRDEADLAAMVISGVRARRYTHVLPVWHLRQVMLFRGERRPEPHRLEDLRDEIVAVPSHSALYDDLMALSPATRPTVRAVASPVEAISDLKAGRVTAVIGNDLTFRQQHVERDIPDVHRVELGAVPFCLVARAGRGDLVPAFFAAYSRLQESGELTAIVERTLLRERAPTVFERWSGYLLGLFAFAATALIGIGVWNRALKSQVETRTRETRAVAERLAFHGLVQAQVSDAIIVLTPDRRITMWNAGAEALYEIPASEALGAQVEAVLTPRVMDVDLEAVKQQIEREGRWRGEARIKRRSGGEVHVEATVQGLRDSNGEAAGRLIVVHDIDARKRAEGELRAALSLHQATLESSADGIVAFDHDGEITSYNQRFLDQWGLTAEAIRSKSAVRDHFREWIENIDEVIERYERVKGTDVSDTVLLRLRDGRTFERESHPQRMGGAIVGRVSSYRDVTPRLRAEEERRRLEAQIQHVQKLESLGVLAGGIAHDFNNLLVGMLGHAGLALMDLPPDSPVRERIQQIETCAMRAAELTNQMLAYSGKGRFVVQPLDLSIVVREMSNLLQTAITKNARLDLNLAVDLPAITADGAQLRQVVMNLITNASDAIGERAGTIAIETGVMTATRAYLEEAYVASFAEPGDYVYVEVRDDGSGMDATTRERIFEPFFTTKFTGRGLGLAAVLGIVRGHRGAVRIESTLGKGTMFRVLFPSCDTPAAIQPLRQPPARAQRKARILVVDDEPAVRMIAREALSRAGFVVAVAEDGDRALEHLRADGSAIDAVLLDMTMPGLNGVDTLRAMHKIAADVPVVLTSGYSEQEAAARCGDQWMAGFIQKPFVPAALVAKMNDVLAASTAARVHL